MKKAAVKNFDAYVSQDGNQWTLDEIRKSVLLGEYGCFLFQQRR